jgi:Na+/H+-dicarboxylate symporter
MFSKMPVILLTIILAIVLFDNYIPLEVKSFIYAASLFIKSLIIFLLPLIIFGLLFKVALSLASNATRIILMILLAVCCSNFISAFLSHYVGIWIYDFELSLITPNAGNTLEPSWTFLIPEVFANDKAMIAGLVLGILGGMFKAEFAAKVANYLDIAVNAVLKSFVYLIPIFVAGFIIKLQFDGVMKIIIEDYALIFVVVALAQLTYVVFLYLLANNFKVQAAFRSIKNMFPAAIVAFSTMSSAVTMPLTIIGVEKNAKDKDMARSVVPATVNIHLLGDCIAIPIFAYAIMKNYGVDEPALMSYLIFTFYFVIARLSAAGIPGGGVLVILPLLEAHLGFNGEMLSLITALYILFDPVITTTNVMGNGGFALVLEKFGIFKKTAKASSS